MAEGCLVISLWKTSRSTRALSEETRFVPQNEFIPLHTAVHMATQNILQRHNNALSSQRQQPHPWPTLGKILAPCCPVSSVRERLLLLLQVLATSRTCCKLDRPIEYAVARKNAQRNTKAGEGSLVAVRQHRVLSPRVLPSKHHSISPYDVMSDIADAGGLREI